MQRATCSMVCHLQLLDGRASEPDGFSIASTSFTVPSDRRGFLSLPDFPLGLDVGQRQQLSGRADDFVADLELDLAPDHLLGQILVVPAFLGGGADQRGDGGHGLLLDDPPASPARRPWAPS